jgi:hypothetical protein
MNHFFQTRPAKYAYVLAEDALVHLMGLPVSSGALHIVAASFTYKSGHWHAGNDGAGSGLDIDLLDGIKAKAFYTGTQWHKNDLITRLSDRP